jgi:DNA-binding winged helix-turn-helix (wHTH) protein
LAPSAWFRHSELLLEDDNPVRVGSRALDILAALVERPGELVGKHELMARVWRGTFVEEGNLKFQVGALRRALGDGRGGRRYIATSAGQGYRFVAPVSVAQAPAAAPLPAHQGRWCFGKTPMQTFLDALPMAREKLMAA